MNLSIKQFRAFLALCEYRNFTRAAESIFLSQPAFSHLIYSIEKAVGVRLFDRNTKRVELTADGVVFQNIAADMMREFNLGLSRWHDHINSEQFKISVAALPSITVKLLPNYIEYFNQIESKATFEVKDLPSDYCVSAVINEAVDLGIVGFLPKDPNVESHKIHTEKYFIVFNKNHPLAKKSTITLDDISHNNTIIRFGPTTSIYQSLHVDIINNESVEYIEIEQLSTLFGLLLSNSGITFLPELTLYMFQHPDILVKPISGGNLTREIYIIKKRDKALSKISHKFYDFLLQTQRIS
ncbi:LysR family transcriptional regulator [Budviciaceae bacterium CWB-B4]|uniref:LysR family transcriptional regulator n=1 Tax=Limnobaculum xujianqingii TaxID=2738837 RepID=A0A9D7AFH0_9GAMM|nr:LysR family transcriptional regulator [Limnobaculum xujianqingii]MBK5071738.1 LysR family transcriptional regulator [Limnobaculum xujianqingii]MBK5175047.1 LysR family transcriptional regulator [Limnobaculum xujianqingii]